MIAYILDATPWWVWLGLVMGGGGALFAFVPGALALAVSIWNVLPRPVKIGLGFLVALLAAFGAGRNRGARNAEERQKQADAAATKTRIDVDREVRQMKPEERDARLEKYYRD